MKGITHNMEQEYFPMCCTLKIVGGFGETFNCDPQAYQDNKFDDAKFREYMHKMFTSLERQGGAALVATTNNEQAETNEALAKFGFHSTPFMKKKLHPDTTVKMWWMSLEEYKEEEIY